MTLKTRSTRRTWLHVVLDIVVLTAIMVAATSYLWGIEDLRYSESVRLGFPVQAIVLGLLLWDGLYDKVHTRRWPGAVMAVCRAVLIGSAVFSLAGFLAAVGAGARNWVFIVSALWLVHLCVHHGLRATLNGNRSRVIVAGNAAQAIEMRDALVSDRRRAHHVLGFVVDGPVVPGDVPRMEKNGAAYPLGTLEDLPALVQVYDADQVIFCMDGLATGGKFAPLARLLGRRGVDVALTGLGDIAPRRVAVSQIEGQPIISIAPSSPEHWQLQVKRLVDIVGSGLLLVLLSPLLAAVALAIRAVDGADPIFRQPRVGKGGRLFTIYKFQTMVEGAEELKIDLTNELDGPVFKMQSDPRITRLGRVLRKTSIDELPQLVNVLRGDMSLVGPRPFVESEVVAAPLSFREREAVTPGMTGHWQVSGRSDTDFGELDELDRWYVDNWSLGEDLGILAKTVPAVLRQKGAR